MVQDWESYRLRVGVDSVRWGSMGLCCSIFLLLLSWVVLVLGVGFTVCSLPVLSSVVSWSGYVLVLVSG